MATKAAGKRGGQKKQKKNVPSGIAYIKSTFNNTIVTITDPEGNVISWATAGSSGFKGAKRNPLRRPNGSG